MEINQNLTLLRFVALTMLRLRTLPQQDKRLSGFHAEMFIRIYIQRLTIETRTIVVAALRSCGLYTN